MRTERIEMGIRVVFGIPKELPPIEGLPPGMVELHFEKSEFYIEVKDGKWLAHPYTPAKLR